MRRRSEEDDGASLDSLLDTMTNVVGILVIVLVVTQLGVGDAVSRITESDAVDPEKLKEAQAQLATVTDRRDELKRQLAALKPVDSKAHAGRLANLQQQLDTAQLTLTSYQQMAMRKQQQVALLMDQAEEAQQQVEQNEKETSELKAQIKSSLDEVARLESIVEEMPERGQLAPKVVTLPNPRPAPEGAKALYFMCVNNKVYPLNVTGARDVARKRAEFMVQSKRLDRDPVNGIDPQVFLDEFDKLTSLKDDYFELEMTVSGGRYPRLTFHPRSTGGFTIQEIKGDRSRFRRLMEATDETQYYARFYVLPDSYEAYVEARRVCSEVGLLAGWIPQGESWEYTTALGGPLRIGPPMEDPKPTSTGTAPSKPPNVID